MVVNIFKTYVPARRIGLFFLEGLVLISMIWIFSPPVPDRPVFVAQVLIFAALIQAMFFYFEMYEPDLFGKIRAMTVRMLLALACALALLMIVFSPARQIRLVSLLNILAVTGLAAVIMRIAYSSLSSAQDGQKVLIIGSGALAESIAAELLRRKDSGFNVLGFVSEAPGRTGERLVNPSIVGDYSQVGPLIGGMGVDRVIIALEDRRGVLPLDHLLECKLRGVRVDDGIDFFERLTGKMSVESMRPSAMIFSPGFHLTRARRFMRRSMSFTISLLGLIIFLPLVLITAGLIKLETPGPVFYRQERVGEGGREFTILKFRSMRVNAEEAGPVWAGDGDPRVTRVGKWIRKYRIDEIPQLWNVLRGDMDLVGPRPERRHFVDLLKKDIPYYERRLAVKPGVTGWSQVCYGYGSTREDALEKLKYDLFYIKHCSVGFDLYIVLQTIKTVLFGKGAR